MVRCGKQIMTSPYSNSLSALLVAVVDLTKVCFGAKIGVCIEALLKVDVVVKVLAFLKLSIVIA